MPEITGYQTIRTIEGDTFDKLALEFYNDEKQAAWIIRSNLDYCNVLTFGSGTELKVPILKNVELPETLPPWRRTT